MDRVGGPGSLQPFLPRKDEASKKGKRSPETTKTGFLGFLTRAETPAPQTEEIGASSSSQEALESLLDEVYASGQELSYNPSPENVVAYKKAVGRFIRQVIDGSVELTETEGRLRKDMKKPKYALLRVVDEKLEKLGAYVLQNQKDKLEILRKVDELQGLLVDLRH
jgi:uncharacterized protein YaaR (DUF327 family)